MILSAGLALLLQNALQLFELLLVFGAGTGLIFILRWFWWRINAWSEITAMFASGIISLMIKLTPLGDYLFGAANGIFEDYKEIPFVVFFTTIIWLAATFLTQPESKEVLQSFYKKIQPGGLGWKKVIIEAKKENKEIANKNQVWSVPSGILAMLLGCLLIYNCMFATGYWIYGDINNATITTILAIISGLLLIRSWKKIKSSVL
jgi:SSS family solute:Na+ symporter